MSMYIHGWVTKCAQKTWTLSQSHCLHWNQKNNKKNYVYFLRSLIIGVHVHDSPLDQTSPEVLQFYVFLWNPLYLAWVPLGPRSTSWISILRFSTVSENRMLPSILWFIDVYSKKKCHNLRDLPYFEQQIDHQPPAPQARKRLMRMGIIIH